MDGQYVMLLLFFFIVGTMLTANWYTKKYKSILNFTQIVVLVFGLMMAAAYFFIKNLAAGEKENIMQDVVLKNTVKSITFDPHKTYFKNMTLDDGQYLPMPESMNQTLQVGDSIYKNKGEYFYTVMHANTQTKRRYDITVHERTMGKP